MRRAAGPKTTAPRVVVSLGGGVRVPLALRLAGAVLAAAPQADVIVAAGFAAPALAGRHACRTIAPATFTRELASATAAVLAGGVSLYEACALRVPTVGVSVVRSQRPTVRELGRRGAVIDAGHLDRAGDVERVARRVAGAVARLLAGPARRRALSRRAGAEIDGLGARRVAAAIHALGRGPAEAAAASRA
jgi:spore coat polysaccharide biosynthesis predicted glycosyltransferase SpsG